MLTTPTPILKKAYTPLPSSKLLEGKKKRKAISNVNSSNKDIVNILEE